VVLDLSRSDQARLRSECATSPAEKEREQGDRGRWMEEGMLHRDPFDDPTVRGIEQKAAADV
jgi:hypothetical protein